MEIEEIKNKIKGFLAKNYPNQEIVLKNDTNLLNEWFTYSVDVINILIFIENNFDITISRKEINSNNFKDLEAISKYVKSKKDTKNLSNGDVLEYFFV